jgi:MoaA/NifB/PqqE/SkfB family radical SAM enzyme
MSNISKQAKKKLPSCIDIISKNNILRKIAAYNFDTHFYKNIVDKNNNYTREIRYARYKLLSNLLSTIEKVLRDKNISTNAKKKIIDVFICRILHKSENITLKKFQEEFGQEPPGFVTISPCKKCNLQCKGCFTGGTLDAKECLDYNLVDKIISEKTKLWNSNFTVISGGEPFMWRSNGKGIIDLCIDHPENYFLIFTNGTLINKKIAKEMAEAGNITPTVSIEGFKHDTNYCRGEGVYEKILIAIENLKVYGVPFGITVTVNRINVERVLSDEFLEFFFEKLGVAYGWIFQYMPIGPDKDLNLMITPEQRKMLFEREQYIINERNIFFPDFWNGGVYSNGCIAGGRPGGYVSIDWNGNVTPCVFYPYSKTNVKKIYKKGGNINEVLKSDLFIEIQKWQREYGFEKSCNDVNNLIAPCGLRDHFDTALKIINETNAEPIANYANELLNDKNYIDKLLKYDKEFLSLIEDVWENEYITEDDEHEKIIIEM